MKPKAKIAKLARVVFNPDQAVIYDPAPANSLHNYRCGKYSHYCYDNNEMLIDENDSEFATCNCGKPNSKT